MRKIYKFLLLSTILLSACNKKEDIVEPPVVINYSIALNTSEVSNALVGTGFKLYAYVSPKTDYSILWESSDENLATVDQKGYVSCIKAGTIYITASVKELDISDNCKVTIKEKDVYIPTIDDYNTTPINDNYESKGYTSVYEDLNFKTGYVVSKTFYGSDEKPFYENPIKIYDNEDNPKWTIAQWSSQYDLLGDESNENNGYILKSEQNGLVNTISSKGKMVNGQYLPAKIVKINSTNGEIYLESNCQIEYENPRGKNDPWVHLLLANSWDASWKIDQLSSIVMDATFTVNKCENYTGSAYNTNMHAAQLVWYITVQNLNRSKIGNGYGRYIWFGIPLWDNRTAGSSSKAYIAHDAGTDTLIYNPSSSEIYINGLQPKLNEEGHACIDIYSYVKEAFDYSKEHGYLENTDWEDLYIGGTNFGYEIPGTFDIGTTINSLGIFAK